MNSGTSLLVAALLPALLSAEAAFAQLKGKKDPKEEERFVSYRQAPVLRLRELDWVQSSRRVEAMFRKDPATGEFVEEVHTALVDAGWWADGKRQAPSSATSERFRIEGRSRKVRLIRHEATLFAKIATIFRPIDGSDVELKAEGMYEMTAVEGDWEGYTKGGSLKLAISAKDLERFVSDVQAAHRQPRFLEWNAIHFREMVTADLRKNLGNPASPASTIAPEEIDRLNVIVTPEYLERGMVFTFEKESLRFDAEEVTMTMRYRSFFPPKGADAAGNWRERYGLVATPQSFYLETHGGAGEKPIHEALPKARWPGW